MENITIENITIKMVLQRRIDEEELIALFTSKEIQDFYRNRVVIIDETTSYHGYDRLIKHLIGWCSENCEGFFMISQEYHENSSACFFFQLEPDFTLFKLTHDNTEFNINQKETEK